MKTVLKLAQLTGGVVAFADKTPATEADVLISMPVRKWEVDLGSPVTITVDTEPGGVFEEPEPEPASSGTLAHAAVTVRDPGAYL